MSKWLDASMGLLAQQDRWREMGAGFRGEHAKLDLNVVWVGLSVLAGVVLFFYVLSRVVANQDQRRVFNSSRALFRSLCAAHALSHAERKLLRQIARVWKYDKPSRVFLEPQCFDAAKLPPALKSHASAISALQLKLFGKPQPDAASNLQATVDLYAAVNSIAQ